MDFKMHFKFEHNGKWKRFVLTDHSDDLLARLKKHITDVVGEKDEFYWNDGETINHLDTAEDLDAAIDFAKTEASNYGTVACVKIVLAHVDSSAADNKFLGSVPSGLHHDVLSTSEPPGLGYNSSGPPGIGNGTSVPPGLGSTARHTGYPPGFPPGLGYSTTSPPGIVKPSAAEACVPSSPCQPVVKRVEVSTDENNEAIMERENANSIAMRMLRMCGVQGDTRIPVMNAKTKEKIIGGGSPMMKDVETWLVAHPEYVIDLSGKPPAVKKEEGSDNEDEKAIMERKNANSLAMQMLQMCGVKGDTHIPVINAKTKEKISGGGAPMMKDVETWLLAHPEYDIDLSGKP